jgi:hypothetical protein
MVDEREVRRLLLEASLSKIEDLRKKLLDSDGNRRLMYVWTREAAKIEPYEPYTQCDERTPIFHQSP